MRVAVVVADLLLRHGLRSVLADAPSVELVAIGEDLASGRHAIRTASPQVLVVGDDLPPLGSGAALLLLAEARSRDICTVVVSDVVDPELAASVIDADAAGWGWLVRSELEDPQQFVSTVLRVARGGTVVSDPVVRELARARRRPHPQ